MSLTFGYVLVIKNESAKRVPNGHFIDNYLVIKDEDIPNMVRNIIEKRLSRNVNG